MFFNMRANGIKSQRFHFIRVEWWHDMRSTTSNPPFVWSYTTLTWGFDLLLIVTLTGWCMVVRQMMFFFPYFFLSMHESIMKILLWWAKLVYFYSLSFSDFITLGMPLQSYCMVHTKVNFWSMPYSAIETEVKYYPLRYYRPQLNLETSGTRYLCAHPYQLRSIKKYHKSLLTGFLAYGSV